MLGSTGSIGTQTLDIVSKNPDKFKVSVLCAKKNWELLAMQARIFQPSIVIIDEEQYFQPLKELLLDLPIKVMQGKEALNEACTLPEIDIVVTAMVGYSGFLPTIKAIESKKTIALANKETLVVGGEIITDLAKKYSTPIIPVDSEHSAIFQCLVGEERNNLHRIFLTASGGPFRKYKKKDLANVTVKDALNHPNWKMGAKVTIDSASMMNKGFEMIEAKWLFDCEPSKIKILVHPQSIVHSMVEFSDGSVKAQLGIPDMRLPIGYALSFPERLQKSVDYLSFENLAQLTFEEPDLDKFPLLRLAFEAIDKGGNMPCILNAANEVAVESFIKEKIKFIDMPKLVQFTMEHTNFIKKPNLKDLIETNDEAFSIAKNWVSNH